MNLELLTLQHKKWLRHNFPDQTPDDAFLGVVEEVGELAHALLKQSQGIREFSGLPTKQSDEDRQTFRETIVDGVGDLVIFLDGFCIGMGLDLAACVSTTWKKVHQRDWIAYPETGMPPREEVSGHVVDVDTT